MEKERGIVLDRTTQATGQYIMEGFYEGFSCLKGDCWEKEGERKKRKGGSGQQKDEGVMYAVGVMVIHDDEGQQKDEAVIAVEGPEWGGIGEGEGGVGRCRGGGAHTGAGRKVHWQVQGDRYTSRCGMGGTLAGAGRQATGSKSGFTQTILSLNSWMC